MRVSSFDCFYSKKYLSMIPFDQYHMFPYEQANRCSSKQSKQSSSKQSPLPWQMPPLSSQCSSNNPSSFIQQACEYLEENHLDTVGLFRQNGNQATSMQLMQEVIDGATLEECVALHHMQVADVCQSIKVQIWNCFPQNYLKAIRIFPAILYPMIESVQTLTEMEEVEEHVRTIVQLLPHEAYLTLKRLSWCFHRIVDHSSHNKMDCLE